MAAQLRQLARRNGTEVAVPELLRRDVRHADAPGLAAAAQLLAAGRCDPPPACPEIKLSPLPAGRKKPAPPLPPSAASCGRVSAAGRWRWSAATSRNTAPPSSTSSGWRTSPLLRRADDARVQRPGHGGAVSAGHCRGAELTEQLTTLAKTGLCALTEEEVCALENYAYTWSPNAAAWRAPFEKNPGALVMWNPPTRTEKTLPGPKRPAHFSSPPPTACARSSALPTPSR